MDSKCELVEADGLLAYLLPPRDWNLPDAAARARTTPCSCQLQRRCWFHVVYIMVLLPCDSLAALSQKQI